MKIKTLILTCLLTFAFLANSIFAATEKWTYDIGVGTVMELAIDGSGGCAVVASLSTGTSVFWFDKKGKKLYEKVTAGTPTITAIIGKNLVYQIQGAEITQVQVDKRGRKH